MEKKKFSKMNLLTVTNSFKYEKPGHKYIYKIINKKKKYDF